MSAVKDKKREAFPNIAYADHLEIRMVEGKGRGVFTTKSIKKGALVEVAPVIPISNADYEMVSYTEIGSYLFTLGETKRSVLALGYASLYNHAGDLNNCEYFTNARVVKIFACRNIKAGEELTIDYGWPDEVTKDFV